MRTTRGAFTLVELLVVISIIALLLALLIPSLASARFTAQETKCLSQLRQIGQGQTAYALEYGYYSPGYATDQASERRERSWYRALRSFMSADEMVWRCDVAPLRYPNMASMAQIVPGFEETRWMDISYGLPVLALALTHPGPETWGPSMGLSLEPAAYYQLTIRNLTACRPEMVRKPTDFVLAGDTNNIGVNIPMAEDIRSIGFHGCFWLQCQNSAHGGSDPGNEFQPLATATNQWVYADGHAGKTIYRDVLATRGRMFRRCGGFDGRSQP